jgi:uncharacterized membrane-anchored protein
MKKEKYTAAWYREQMNLSEKQLNQENYQYFDDLRGYLSLAGLVHDEAKLNQVLFGMQQDLLDAQKNGIRATELFGNQPKQMADEILQELPPIKWRNRLQLYSLVTLIIWTIQFFSAYPHDGALSVNLSGYLLSAILANAFVYLIFKLVSWQIYRSKKINVLIGLLTGLLIIVGGVLFFYFEQYSLFNWKIELSFLPDLIISAAIILIAIFWGRKSVELYPAIFMIFILGTNQLLSLFLQQKSPELAAVSEPWQNGILIFCFLLFISSNFRMLKKISQSKKS